VGAVEGRPLNGLPGNPVSSLVGVELFVRPAILKMQGRTDIERPRLTAVTEEALSNPPHLEQSSRGVARRDGRAPAPARARAVEGAAQALARAVLARGRAVADGASVERRHGRARARAAAMNVSAPFIRRPVATTLLAAAILLSGIAAYTQLPVAPLPRVDFPTINVNAGLPGASPETMAAAVAIMFATW